ncbi:hypothetical protein J2792_001327 [Novosphingobium capsulatum]|uniref:Uncharacterized protein n=1 Tax=Novosphingobium capsulatum TaxID=13688 RepID=A0ABU1MKA9_9SPHN|nr:hypothetical protein [Novosphingobium capsulatum]
MLFPITRTGPQVGPVLRVSIAVSPFAGTGAAIGKAAR